MASNTADMGFNVFALDKASKTFIKLAQRLERLDEKLDKIDGRHATAHVDVDVDKGEKRINDFADTSVSVMAGAFRIVSANAIVMGAAVAAALAALPAVAALAATGIVLGVGGALAAVATIAAAQSKRVKNAFSDLADHVKKVTTRIAAPFEDTLVVVANVARQTFDSLAPALEKSFALMAPAVSRFVGDFGQAFSELGPALAPLSRAFRSVLEALGPQLDPLFEDISSALTGLGRTVSRNADEFAGFIGVLLKGIPLAITGVSKLAQWFVDAKNAITHSLGDADSTLSRLIDVVTELGSTALPLLQSSLFGALGGLTTLAKLALTLAEAFAKLPEPVQQFGIALAGASFVAPKLVGAMQSVGNSISGFVGGVRDAETRTQRLAQAARGAAGVAGLAGLVMSAQTSNKSLQVLGNTASGAALGFSVGGPWGAAIGGAAGALLGLSQATDGASSAQKRYAAHAAQAAENNQRLIATIDGVTGAYTRQTRVELARQLQHSDEGRVMEMLGVSFRDTTRAILGNESAWKRVVAQVQRAHKEGKINGAFMHDFLQNIRKFGPALQREQKAIRKSQDAANSWGKTLKSLPNKVVTELREVGFAPTVAKVKHLAKQYDLTPKQIRTIIKTMGVDASVKDILGVHNNLKKLDREKAQPKVDMGPAQRSAQSGANRILGTLHNMESGANAAGQSAGSSLAQGLAAAIQGSIANVAAAAAALINGAEAAARAAADSHSPSRVWKKIGIDLVKGLKEGLLDRSERGQIRQAVHDLVHEANDAFRREVDKATQALDNALSKLKSALQARQSIVSGFQSGFTSSIFGSTRGTEDIPITGVGGMIKFAKQERGQARHVNGAIRKLIEKGLSKSLVRQLLSQGEAGQAQLFALADDASRKELKRLNRLNAQRLKALHGAGMAAGNLLVGPRIERARDRVQERREELREAKRDARDRVRDAKAYAHEIEKLLDKGIRLKIDGKHGNIAHLYKRGG